MDKVKAFALTLRPKDGVTDEHVNTMVTWIRKKCEYYYVITEKTGWQRHVHAGIFMKKECTRSNVVTMVMRLYPEMDPSEKTVFRNGIKIMYNPDFIRNYMEKGDDTEVIARNLPEKHLESYFPEKPKPKEEKAKRVSLMYHELERLWYERNDAASAANTKVVRDFLWKLMYDERIWPMIEDDKRKIQVAKNLTRWINRHESCYMELPDYEKEES